MGLSCREYMFHSRELAKSIFPCSTCLRVADSIGCGRPIDLRKATAACASLLAMPVLREFPFLAVLSRRGWAYDRVKNQ